MDSTETILKALAEGATHAVLDKAGGAIKGAYEGLRSLLRGKVSKIAGGEATLDKFETKPEVWRPALQDVLTDAQVGNDADVLKQAQALLAQLSTLPSRGDKIDATFNAPVQGAAFGHQASVHITNHGPEAGDRVK